jgi:hypothetical protein
MSHSERLLKSPATFRRLTGLTPSAFHRLVGEVGAADRAARQRRAARPDRSRAAGAGRKPALPLGDAVLMLLVYYRTYVPHTFLGFLFGIDDSTVCRSNRRLEPLLAGVFRIPERRIELTPEDLRELFVDSTERPIGRPVRGQRRFYSGKKKRHTLKTQVVAVRARKARGERRRVRIVAVSRTFPGSVHDKKVYDRSRVRVPRGVPGYGDTAYKGTGLRTPHRTPRGGELTARQRAGNRRLGRKRIAVEHGIGKMKVWRIAGERWRQPRRRHTLVMKNVAGLHNRMFGE